MIRGLQRMRIHLNVLRKVLFFNMLMEKYEHISLKINFFYIITKIALHKEIYCTYIIICVINFFNLL